MLLLTALAAAAVNEKCVAPVGAFPAPPDNSTLRLVELVTRHGARTPTSTYLPIPRRGAWLCDSETAIATRFSAVPQVRPRRIHNILDTRLVDYPPNCRSGDLTVDGMLEHKALGASYRKYLIEQQKLLPEALDNGLLYLHATHSQRTYDSALSFMQGLYEPVSMNEILTIESGISGKDYFHPERKSCAELKQISKNYTHSHEFKTYMNQVAQKIQPILDELNVTDPSADDIDGACDFAFTFWCNGNSVIPGLTDEMIDTCMEYNGKMMYGMYSTSPGVAGSPAMREIFRIMDESILQKPVRFALISSHDSTVAALLTMLGYTEKYGPAYASHLAFELWEDDATKEMYIRVVYNGKEIPLINEKTLVKLHEFRQKIGVLTNHCPEFV